MFGINIAVVLLLVCSVKGTPIILSPPQPVNATLGSTAEFTCICHYCLAQSWRVNDLAANHQDNLDKGIIPSAPFYFPNGSKIYTLSMPATVQLNESAIECVVYNGSYSKSPMVLLLVQGLLPEVGDATVTQINSTTLLLQYTAPYTLTGVPILYYNILILPTNISVNITGTQYNIYITEYCINYNISITPCNSVGMGNTTILSDVVIYQAPVITMPQLIQDYRTGNGVLQVYVKFQYNNSCIGTAPQSVLLTVNEHAGYYCSLVSHSPTNNCSIITTDIDNIVNVSINITELLEYGAVYNVNMSLATVNNVESNDFSFDINTYHVVSAIIISFNETTICLECSFRHNSPSTGCYAVFHPINHTGGVGVSYHKIIKSLVDTTASDCINTLPNGVYIVSVLDVLSYEEERYNNTAVTISSLITINGTTSTTTLLLSPTAMILINDTTSSFFYTIPSSLSVSMVATSGLSVPTRVHVLLIILSSTISMVIIIIITTVPLIGVYLIKKRKKRSRGAKEATTIQVNEAYGSLPNTGGMQTNIAYESISKGLQSNIAYNSITGLKTDAVYDTITDIQNNIPTI